MENNNTEQISFDTKRMFRNMMWQMEKALDRLLSRYKGKSGRVVVTIEFYEE